MKSNDFENHNKNLPARLSSLFFPSRLFRCACISFFFLSQAGIHWEARQAAKPTKHTLPKENYQANAAAFPPFAAVWFLFLYAYYLIICPLLARTHFLSALTFTLSPRPPAILDTPPYIPTYIPIHQEVLVFIVLPYSLQSLHIMQFSQLIFSRHTPTKSFTRFPMHLHIFLDSCENNGDGHTRCPLFLYFLPFLCHMHT